MIRPITTVILTGLAMIGAAAALRFAAGRKAGPRPVAAASGGGGRHAARPGASLALDNLRAVVILLVLSFHSVLAYLRFLPAAPFPFDAPPYKWTAFPVVDPHRWLGFDLFCAWQDVFLMTLFFFLSGLFVWPSLVRKGAGRFLYERVLRIGVPFAAVAALLMPLATYPVYLQTAADPGFSAYWRRLLALPLWPCGPMWFLWLLLAGDSAAATLYRLMPRRCEAMVRPLAAEGTATRRLFALLAASALAYVPLALIFGPMPWSSWGPFSFQLSRPLHYAVYFFAGIALGAHGIERRLFAPDGALARHWPRWLAAAVGSLLSWMALTALTMHGNAPLALQAVADLSFVLACFANCFGVLAVILRFARRRSRLFDSLKDNAYGMYLVHYVFVVWLQYALLGADLPAVLKSALVFAGTLLASWGATAGLRSVPAAAPILGAASPRGAAVPS
jgi:GNAT superfamily N-acetyltransferase